MGDIYLNVPLLPKPNGGSADQWFAVSLGLPLYKNINKQIYIFSYSPSPLPFKNTHLLYQFKLIYEISTHY